MKLDTAGPMASQLKQVFSWLAIGPAVSNFIGPFCAGLMIDNAGSAAGSTEGYRAAFALMAVLPLLIDPAGIIHEAA
jgi:MFS family permease